MNKKSIKGINALEYFEKEIAEDSELRTEVEALQPEYEAMRAVMNLRIQKGLTQQQLSEATGINQADISKIERGTRNPTVKLLGKIAQALDMDLKIEFVPKRTAR